ncbi:MAG: hypothetical protein RR614_03175 [Eubacterium sp.]
MGLLVSFLLNYFVLPIPLTIFSNAMGNGISGLISGFMGGFVAIIMFVKGQREKA